MPTSAPEVRPARGDEVSGPGLAHALATDPDGCFAAGDDPGGPARGLAVGVVRGETLLLVHLEVAEGERGHGLGTALLEAVKAHGRTRGSRGLEVVSPLSSLGFFLRRGLPMRTLSLRLEAAPREILQRGEKGAVRGSGDEAEGKLTPVAAGAGLSGWVADLDRETRGFARTPEWTHWLRAREAEAWALKRRGRPEAIALILKRGTEALLGPIEARTPAAAAAVIPLLARRAAASGVSRVVLTLPSEARPALDASFRAGFRLVEPRAVLSTRARGDLRRYAASGELFW